MKTAAHFDQPSEFELIKRYFTHPCSQALLGVGDDCALLSAPKQEVLAISSDMLVEGQHFFSGTDPYRLGYKSLAVNLSDLAAMGAKPLAFTLALALPNNNPEWLAAFSKGMMSLAKAHHCDLIGGDTTRGPLTISITILGSVAPQSTLRRDMACIDDDIWVSGELGDARLALAILRGSAETECVAQSITEHELQQIMARLECPEPRIALGLALYGLAHAAIDISDGLISDLSHILTRSQCGASIYLARLPISAILIKQPQTVQQLCLLAGGDDYELCFTAPFSARSAIYAVSHRLKLKLTRIGKVEIQQGLRLLDHNEQIMYFDKTGFDHFV